MPDLPDLGDVEKAATQKVGPLPAWGWGLIAGAAGLAVYFLVVKRQQGTATATATRTAGDGSAALTTSSGGAGDGIPDDTSSTSSATGTSSATTATYADNNQAWLQRATSDVAAAFGAAQGDVYSALYSAIGGGQVTSTGMRYWSRALADLGVPPEGTSGAPTVVDPVTAPDSSSTSSSGASPVAQPVPVYSAPVGPPSQGPVVTAPVASPTPPAPAPVSSPPPSKAPAPVAPTPAKAPAPAAPKPAWEVIRDAPIGSKVTLGYAFRGYATADAANADKGIHVSTGPGTFYVYNRAQRGGGWMVNVTRVKGVPGAWIKP